MSEEKNSRWLLETTKFSPEQVQRIKVLYELSSEQLCDLIMSKRQESADAVAAMVARIAKWGLDHLEPDQYDRQAAAVDLADALCEMGLARHHTDNPARVKVHDEGCALLIIYERGPWECVRVIKDHLLPQMLDSRE